MRMMTGGEAAAFDIVPGQTWSVRKILAEFGAFGCCVEVVSIQMAWSGVCHSGDDSGTRSRELSVLLLLETDAELHAEDDLPEPLSLLR